MFRITLRDVFEAAGRCLEFHVIQTIQPFAHFGPYDRIVENGSAGLRLHRGKPRKKGYGQPDNGRSHHGNRQACAATVYAPRSPRRRVPE